MSMTLLISSIVVFIAGAFFSSLCQGEIAKKLCALGGVFLGSCLGLIPAISALVGKDPLVSSFIETLPGLPFRIGMDPLSAFFLVPIFGLAALTAIYAWGYLKGEKQLLTSLPFFPLLVASMMGVVIAQDGFLFLIVWEIMSLSSFFLVTAEHERREVRHAGWLYLASTHFGTAFLLLFFIFLFKLTGSFAFENYVELRSVPFTGFLFLCALVGFGTKAGIFPLHIWLPHAHPAAPSYISALMSGVMIKTGIYGILRTLTFLKTPPAWCGELLIFLGIISAVLGVLYALMQHDIKKLLAYHSVENIGIIIIGIGLGLIGRREQNSLIELLGFGGALFHVLNHAIFKGLLFLGAGNILHATHRRRIDQLGGLVRTMPLTGITFLVAAAAICGLPPLNGFVSEWFLYLGLFEGAKVFSHAPFFFCTASIVSLALAGGLAVACFSKVFGTAFLGLPRVKWEREIKEQSWQQYLPMGILAIFCLVLGVIPQLVFPSLLAVLSDLSSRETLARAEFPFAALGALSLTFTLLIGFFLISWLGRSLIFSTKIKRLSQTWDCGFDQPSARMQYTASSYADPLGTVFNFLLKPIVYFRKPEETFPRETDFETHVEDLSERLMFQPLVQKIVQIFSWVRKRQNYRVQDYLAYIFATLLFLLLWEVWIGI